MKLAIAFLLLGICLVPTNANYGRRRMTNHEGHSHARMFTQCMQRWIEIEKCNRRCSEIERACRQRAFLENVCFLLKLLAHDLQLEFAELLGRLNCGVHISYVVSAVQYGNIDQLSTQLTYSNAWNLFYKGFARFMNEILVSVNVDLGYSIASVNTCLGKSLEAGYGPIRDVVNVFHNIVSGGGKSKSGNVLGGLVGGLAGAVDHAAGAAVNSAGGLAGAVSNLPGSFAGAASNLVGNLAGTVGNAAGAAGNLAGGLTGAAGNLPGSLVGGALGAAGGFGGAAGGLGGGVAGGLPGGAFSAAGHAAGGFGGSAGGLPGGAGHGGVYYSKGSSYSPR